MMDSEITSHCKSRSEGRPYRSHLHPACFPCKKRKSRCKTKSPAETCIMCQAHGTECIFPTPDDHSQRPRILPPKSPAHSRPAVSQPRHDQRHTPYPIPHTPTFRPADPNTCRSESDRQISIPAGGPPEIQPTPQNGTRAEGLPDLIGIVEETCDDSSHIVSPAVADDNDILESYLSTVPPARRRCLIPTNPASNRPLRPVRFNFVPRRPLGVTANQSLASSKCEVIEKYMDPDIGEFINLCVYLWSLVAGYSFFLWF